MQSVIGRPAMRRACSRSPTEARRYACAPVQHATCNMQRESGSQSRTKAHSVAVPSHMSWAVLHAAVLRCVLCTEPVARLRRPRRRRSRATGCCCTLPVVCGTFGTLARWLPVVCGTLAPLRVAGCLSAQWAVAVRFASMRARNAAKSADCSWDRLSSDGRRFEVATWRISALAQHATWREPLPCHVA
jgi:hypothetical protein